LTTKLIFRGHWAILQQKRLVTLVELGDFVLSGKNG
jgi:hypothetical protein